MSVFARSSAFNKLLCKLASLLLLASLLPAQAQRQVLPFPGEIIRLPNLRIVGFVNEAGTLLPRNTATLSGSVIVKVVLPEPLVPEGGNPPAPYTYEYSDIILQLDTQDIHLAGDRILQSNGSRYVEMEIDTTEYHNGPHTLTVRDQYGFRDSVRLSLSNLVGSFFVEPVIDPSGEDVPATAAITATLSSAQPWTVSIVATDGSGQVMKTFSGNSATVNVSWNGTDASGEEVENDEYEVRLAFAQNPSQNRQKTTTKKRRGDAFVLIDKGTMGGGSQTKAQREQIRYGYKNFLLQRLRPLRGTLFSGINYMTFDTKDMMNNQTGLRIKQAVVNQLSVPLQLLYVNGHGGDAPHPFFGMGYYTFYSYLLPSDAQNRGNARIRGFSTDLRALTQNIGYGNFLDPPGLVWIDACDSAGTGAGSDQDAFGVTYSVGANAWGVFLGWQAQCNIYGTFAPPDDAWDFWRRQLWQELFVSHRNFQTAIDRADTYTRNRGYGSLGGFNPVDFRYWTGAGNTSF